MRGTAIRDITPNQLESMPRSEVEDFISEIHDLRERYETAVREAGLCRDLADRAERYAAERREALVRQERRAEKAEADRDGFMKRLIEVEHDIANWLERTITIDDRYRRAAEDIRSGAWNKQP